MVLANGYVMTTSFFRDFTIAETYGAAAVQDTYNKIFAKWKNEYVHLSELSIVTNNLMWHHHKEGQTSQSELCELYKKLYLKTDSYAHDHLTGEHLNFYYKVMN